MNELTLPIDFREFIQALNESDVEYVLVGGYAVVYHGYLRTTGDMDIWVNRTVENYHRLVSAFTCFGMPVFDMTRSNFLDVKKFDVFTFGVPPMAIDIMTQVNFIYTCFIDNATRPRCKSIVSTFACTC